jgi:hypothetical protein
MRKAFSLLTAIFILILMSLLATFILNISSKSVKATVLNYKKEQAALYAKSYTELAIMAATANDSNVTNCAETITGYVGESQADVDVGIGYDIQTNISYIGNGLVCTNVLNTADIETPNTLYIIVDTYVRYRTPSLVEAIPTLSNVPWVTYHRRTLQKL